MRVLWPKTFAILFLLSFMMLGAPLPLAAQQGAPAHSWPHVMVVQGAQVTVYQPQAISWPDHKTLTARAAIAITRPGDAKPILGTIDVSLATETDVPNGTVSLSDPHLVASHFPSLDTAQAAKLDAEIKAGLPQMQTKSVPLDAVLLSLKETPQAAEVAVNNDPPTIFYSGKPASLVVFDGEPVLAPVGHTGLSFAVNTNWSVFVDHGTWYLLNNEVWLGAPAASGPYHAVSKLPAAFSAIPNDANFADVRKHIPARPSKAQVPTIFVSTKPAEIIVTAGAPQFAPIAGTSLQYVKNTDNDLFFDPAHGRFYYLVSGRWFSAPGLDGPWAFATGDLPPDFALIPPKSERGRVLASVPGTAEAQLAVLQAQVPRQATLKKASAKMKVVYSGPPLFKPIPGTTISYAVNTGFEVIEVGSKYYACYQGAWFVAPSPTGPWVLAASVPAVIYTIPPSSPLYPVTYVKVYAATPTTVTYGYTAGYTMGFVSAGVLVYGTGYYYPPVVVPGPVPIFYPYPYSYAGNVWYNSTTSGWARGGTVYGPYGGAATGGTYYNPSTGAWARGGAVYGPYGGAGAWSAYNPTTGAYAHGSAAWGTNGGTAYASAYNPRTGISASTTQNANPYQRWGSSTISGPNQTVNTASGSNARGSAGAFQSSTGAAGAGYHGVNGNSGGVVRGAGGNVYAGRDGNVYQHSSSGWSQWNNGTWQSVQPPANSANRQTAATNSNFGATHSTSASDASGFRQAQNGTSPRMNSASYQQLEQDRQARTFGAQRQFAGRFQGGAGSGRGGFGGGFGGGRFRR